MKYLKTYEKFGLNYDIGDIVVCINPNIIKSDLKYGYGDLEYGKKYKVINMEIEKLLSGESRYLIRLVIQNLETGEISRWVSDR